MIDEDVVGLAREVTGESLVVCDLCGQPVAASSLLPLAGRAGGAEPVEAIRACPECRRRIEQDEISFDDEIAAGLQAADDE